MAVLCDVATWNLVDIDHSFRGVYCLHVQGISHKTTIFTLIAVRKSDTTKLLSQRHYPKLKMFPLLELCACYLNPWVC